LYHAYPLTFKGRIATLISSYLDFTKPMPMTSDDNYYGPLAEETDAIDQRKQAPVEQRKKLPVAASQFP